jgi:hypothetical protein
VSYNRICEIEAFQFVSYDRICEIYAFQFVSYDRIWEIYAFQFVWHNRILLVVRHKICVSCRHPLRRNQPIHPLPPKWWRIFFVQRMFKNPPNHPHPPKMMTQFFWSPHVQECRDVAAEAGSDEDDLGPIQWNSFGRKFTD